MTMAFSTIRNEAGDSLPVARGEGGLSGLLEFVEHHRGWLHDQLQTPRRGAAAGLRAAHAGGVRGGRPRGRAGAQERVPRDLAARRVDAVRVLGERAAAVLPDPAALRDDIPEDPPRRLMFACLDGGAGEAAGRRRCATCGRSRRSSTRGCASASSAAVSASFATMTGRRVQGRCSTCGSSSAGTSSSRPQTARWWRRSAAAQGVFTDLRWGPGDRLRLISEHDALRSPPGVGRAGVVQPRAGVSHLDGRARGAAADLRGAPASSAASRCGASRGSIDAGKRRFNRAGRAVDPLHAPRRARDRERRPRAPARRDLAPHDRGAVAATGDMVVIDNAAVSHGRLPYRGPRQVVVAWA
jgi:hypothetical protein